MNIHAGITPAYRGVHGLYWALVNDDAEQAGVTVHLVDKGIDTGDVLYQKKIEITSKDNFSTYPLIQLGEGILLLKKAIDDFLKDDLKAVEVNTSKSRLWYHPTLLFYLKSRILKNIK